MKSPMLKEKIILLLTDLINPDMWEGEELFVGVKELEYWCDPLEFAFDDEGVAESVFELLELMKKRDVGCSETMWKRKEKFAVENKINN